jgi:hypothetical protein
VWKILLVVSGAGALGGLLNALMGGAGFVLPRLTVVAGSHVLAPGFIGNVLAGVLAALISFGLYGPFSTMPILKTSQPPPKCDALTRAADPGSASGCGADRLLWQSMDHGRSGQAVQPRDGGGHRAARGGSSVRQGIIERDENRPHWHAINQSLGDSVTRTLHAVKVPAGGLRGGEEVEQRGQVTCDRQTELGALPTRAYWPDVGLSQRRATRPAPACRLPRVHVSRRFAPFGSAYCSTSAA